MISILDGFIVQSSYPLGEGAGSAERSVGKWKKYQWWHYLILTSLDVYNLALIINEAPQAQHRFRRESELEKFNLSWIGASATYFRKTVNIEWYSHIQMDSNCGSWYLSFFRSLRAVACNIAHVIFDLVIRLSLVRLTFIANESGESNEIRFSENHVFMTNYILS